MQDVEKELVSLRKHLSVLEDHQIEAMLALEESEASDTAAREALTRAQAAFTEKSAGWLGKKEQETRLLERLKAERAVALPPVTPENLKTYDGLRRRKSGVAVATASDGSCSVCGGTIRPSELQAARTAQELVFCSSCGRIFYAG
jgi:predicted  nucleic acid-binding Zn-ribbon protein